MSIIKWILIGAITINISAMVMSIATQSWELLPINIFGIVAPLFPLHDILRTEKAKKQFQARMMEIDTLIARQHRKRLT